MNLWVWALWGLVALLALDAQVRSRRALREARGLGRAHHELVNRLVVKAGRERARRQWFQTELRDYLLKLREFLRWGPALPPDFNQGPFEDDSDPGKGKG